MGGGKQPRIAHVLAEIKGMLNETRDGRATALAELREAEDGDPFKILIGTILSHRTRDENTSKATGRLFAVFRTPAELAGASEARVRRLIKPVGFYNRKAKSVIAASRQIVDEFGGEVPSKLEDLLTIQAVGRKTANCVLVYGFNKPAIPVDTHVHRISNRLGLVATKDPEETEEELTATVPKRYWLELNDLFVRFGQTTCRPVGPRCEVCTLRPECKYYRDVVRKKAG
jgi:endonuclease III